MFSGTRWTSCFEHALLSAKRGRSKPQNLMSEAVSEGAVMNLNCCQKWRRNIRQRKVITFVASRMCYK